MVFIRLIVLVFLAFITWQFGHIENPNGFGNFMGMLFFIVGPALYLLPIYEATSNDHPSITSIALVNILLGWTLLGWVTALIWSLNKPQAQLMQAPNTPPPAPQHDTKACPMCAESILIAAIKCKHCGADLALITPQ